MIRFKVMGLKISLEFQQLEKLLTDVSNYMYKQQKTDLLLKRHDGIALIAYFPSTPKNSRKKQILSVALSFTCLLKYYLCY